VTLKDNGFTGAKGVLGNIGAGNFTDDHYAALKDSVHISSYR
jgi:hypothetical protein